MLPNKFEIKDSSLVGYKRLDPVLWAGTDTEELFNEHIKKYPDHPDLLYYKERPITYRYNLLGHRTGEFQKLAGNKKPYILVTGDSFSEGLGLHQEETYAEVLSKLTGFPVYNLALAGTGHDIMLHNLMAWKSFYTVAPRILVIQWSQLVRTSSFFNTDDGLTGSLLHVGGKMSDQFFQAGLELDIFRTRAKLAEALIRQHYKTSEIVNVHIPSWETTEYGTHRSIVWKPEKVEPHFARDLGHRGYRCHADLAQRILKQLT